ncbi:hypothetical protein [Celeribacter sp.]|uniref:hypothetical protein n=1 Tax=Celeribacter sp. TaxID=1890673 RepID=UPI003A8F3B1F
MENRLYLMLIEAEAASSTHLIVGRRYLINCFAVAESPDGAKAPVDSFFSKFGWRNIDIQKIKEVPLRLSAIPTPELKEAARKAAEKGVGYVVYDKPVNGGPANAARAKTKPVNTKPANTTH